MKRFAIPLFIGLLAVCFSVQVQAQDKPAPSPLGKVYQRVGVTDMEVTYSRPGVKERTIFAADGLVPFGKLWRTGANRASKVSFSTDVMIGDTKVAAGTYAIFSIPGAEEWTLIINKNADQGGTGNYDESKDAVRVTATPGELPFSIENFSFGFNNVKDTSVDLMLYWEKTIVSIPITVEKTWE